jgi:hypothetical protein
MVGTAGFEQPQATHFVRTALRAACGTEPAVMKVGAPLAKARSRPHTPGSRVRIQDFESRHHQSEDLGILIRIGDRDGGIQTSAARGLRPRRSLREGRAGQPADIIWGSARGARYPRAPGRGFESTHLRRPETERAPKHSKTV